MALQCLEQLPASFHWQVNQPNCGFVVDTRSVWNHHYVTDTHSLAAQIELLFLLLSLATHTHTPAVDTCEPRLVCVEHSTVMPPLRTLRKPSCAPPACIRWAGGRGPVCFIRFVLILQSVSNSGRECWARGLLLYCMHVLLKCRETGRETLGHAVIWLWAATASI